MKQERKSSKGFLGKVSYSKDRGKDESLFELWILSGLYGIPGIVCNDLVIRKPSPREQVHMPKLVERRKGKNWNLW